MERALAHWLNTMHPTPGNTASDRLEDAARAVEPKDTWTPVSADQAERVVRALVDEATVGEPGAAEPMRSRVRTKPAFVTGAVIFSVATVAVVALISRNPAQSDEATASLAGQAPPHGHPSSPGEAAHNPIQEQAQEMNRATIAAAAAGLIVAGESFAQSAVQWRVEDGGNGHWYQYVSERLAWPDANSRAAAASGYLVTLTSQAENAFVNSIVPTRYLAGGSQKSSSCEPACDWQWSNGEAWSYSNWNPGEPNNAGNEDYLLVNPGFPGWNDITAEQIQFVIEWSADCNFDGIVDYGQCRDGSLADSNANNVPDCCEQQLPCGGIDFGRQLHLEFVGSCVDSSPYDRVCQATEISYSVSPDGTPDSAASFDGVTSEIQVSGVPIPVNNSFSWALWLRCDQVGILDQAIVERIEAVGNNLMSPSLFVRPSGALGFGSYSFTSGGTSVESAPGTVQPNKWIHVACTSALNGERTVFVNGTAIASGKSADYGQQLGLILIGRDRNDCCTRFRGAIDDLRIYDRCISPSEVVEIFERVPQCHADLTSNGTVDGADLGALLAFWGPVNPVFPQADINGDGAVNGADLGVLLSVWGPCGG